jgi:hypothetical protein
MEVLLCGTLTYQHYRDGKKTELTKQGWLLIKSFSFERISDLSWYHS